MMYVVDANVVVSSLLKKGVTFELFLLNRAFKKFEFAAPEFLRTEVDNHRGELLRETKLAPREFDDVMDFLMNEITIVPASEFLERLPEARRILAGHPKDIPYLALALKLKCPILSGDKTLKKLSPIEVLSPRDLLDIL